jgi:hypothetical protein
LKLVDISNKQVKFFTCNIFAPATCGF